MPYLDLGTSHMVLADENRIALLDVLPYDLHRIVIDDRGF